MKRIKPEMLFVNAVSGDHHGSFYFIGSGNVKTRINIGTTIRLCNTIANQITDDINLIKAQTFMPRIK